MEATPPPNTNPLAWLALVLGILAPLTCGATAPFALLFGYLALRRVHLSDGRLPGLRAARIGMILGAATVVLFLVGLFVVGLVHLRDKSEVTVCSNNLRRIGFAVNLYHDQKNIKHYPPGTIPLADVPPDRRLSWMVSILPYMEADPTGVSQKGQALYDRFDRNRGWDVAENRAAMTGAPTWFTCPAAPRTDPTLTHYVGLAGFGADAATLGKDDPLAGFFGYERVISRADVTRGTSETMMVTERAVAHGPWAAGGPATVAGVDPREQPYVPHQFGGLHPHGANVLFADGHVAFIPDSASPVVWEEQCRIHREE